MGHLDKMKWLLCRVGGKMQKYMEIPYNTVTRPECQVQVRGAINENIPTKKNLLN